MARWREEAFLGVARLRGCSVAKITGFARIFLLELESTYDTSLDRMDRLNLVDFVRSDTCFDKLNDAKG